MIKYALTTLALAITLPAQADDIQCRGPIGARTIDGNVIVPRAASCTLTGTYVIGNVELRDDAQILIRSAARIDGNVQTDGAARVRIRNSEVGGNVQLTGVDFDQKSLVYKSQVGGTVDWNDNSAPFLLRFSNVDSDVKINQNSGQAKVFDNTIGGNLQCQSNEPAPKGGRNIVDGNKEDQCGSF